MVKMIRPDAINFRATVTEDEIKQRLADEVLESVGGMGDNGKPLPGVHATVRRGSGRAGGYTIDVTGPMPVRLSLPKAGE